MNDRMSVWDWTEKVLASVRSASGFSKKCFIILSLFLSATLFAATAPYGTAELTFTGESHANPYTEVDFEATFTGPEGTTMTVPGFWDGGNTWKIRFAPTKIGTWEYVTHATNDSLLDNKTGSIECSGAKEKGWMIVDTNNPKHFKWSGSENPYLLLGDAWWGHLSDSTNGDGSNFPYSKFTQLVDEWSDAGYSYAYCMLASWRKSVTGWYNEGERPWAISGGDFDLNRPNPAYFQKVDARIAYANSKGICIALLPIESKGEIHDLNVLKRIGKYALARWAGANVSIWLAGEYNDAEGEPFTVEQYDELGDYLQTQNPYHHPISIHCLGWEASAATPSGSTMEDFGDKAWHDYVVQQGYPVNSGEPYGTKEIVSEINKPFISSEFYMGWSSWTQTPEWEMQHCWEVLMGGGYFCTGHAKVAYVNYYGWSGAEPESVTFNNYLSIMRDFFTKKSVNFNRRVSANYLITSGGGYAYRIGDDEFVIYRPTKGTNSLNLNGISGTFGVTAIDLRTGAEAELQSVDGGSIVSLSTPDSGHEWILRVYRTSAPNNNGTEMGPENEIAEGMTPGIAVDSQGDIHMVYMNNMKIYYKKGNADEQFGAAEEIPSPEGDAVYNSPYVVVDDNDVPHVVFKRDWTSASKKCWYTNRIGGSWKTPVLVFNYPNARVNTPKLALHGSVAYCGVFTYGDTTYGKVAKIVNLDSTPVVSKTIGSNYWVPTPVVDSTGRVFVSGRKAKLGNYYQEYDQNLNLVGSEKKISIDAHSKTGETDGVLVDHNDNMYVVGVNWSSDGKQEFWYNTSERVANSQSVIFGMKMNAEEQDSPWLAENSQHKIYMSYRDSDTGQGKIAELGDEKFGDPIVFSEITTDRSRFHPMIACSGNEDKFHITWESNGKVYIRSVTPGETSSTPADIMIDNIDIGYSESTGWSSSTSTAGYYGSDYRYDGTSGADSDKWAKWAPAISQSGNYNVYMRWTSYSNRPDQAPLEIKYNGGMDTSKTVDQTKDGGVWVFIGKYDFSAGADNYVKILASDTGYTIADAVKFEYDSPSATIPTEIVSPSAATTFAPGETVTATGTGDNLSWSIDRTNDGAGPIATGGGSSIAFTIPADSTESQDIVITLTGDAGSVSQTHDIAIPASVNEAPVVDAGNDQTITLPASANLNATVTDDGLPGAYTVQWSKVSGPGTVTFANADTEDTTASFSQDGTYVIRLTANDTELQASDDLTVTVNPESSTPADIIIDNNESGYSESTGWASSTSTSGYYETDYRYDGTSGTDSDKWAKWAPAISESGNYNVYMRWTSYSNRPDQAPLEIKYNGGMDTSKTVDQTKDGGVWVFIGKYEFIAGADNYVKILASDTGYTIADAVKFEYDSPSATIPTVIVTPSAATTFAPGETVTATGTGDNLSWSIDRLNDGAGPIATGSGSSIEFAIPADSTESQDIVITLTGDAGNVSQTHDIAIPAPVNEAPVVDAGNDQTITLPAIANLNATVTDDGLPAAAYTTHWTIIDGPGTVTFGDADAEDTTVGFSQDGTYVLRLTADDNALQASDDLTVIVNPEPVDPPTGNPLVYEAEDMTLNNYEVNASTTASGGELINLSTPSGTASCTFNEASGSYNLSITSIDENDGQGSLEVRINGSLVGVAVLDRDTDSGALDTFETFDIASGITINNGDDVEITGYRDIGEHARVDYITFTPVDAGETELNISGLNPAEYELVDSGLTVGATQYIDRDYTFDSVPAFLEGQTYIKTANDDKVVQGDNFLVFDVNKDVTVYVAHDDRYTVKPAWLDDFTDTGEDLTSGGGSFSLFSKTCPAGTVVLGGNSPDGTGFSMYTVVIVKKINISGLAPSNYEVIDSGLSVGATQYIDRDYTFTSVPSFLEGQTYIKTANDDKVVQGDNFLIFDVNKPVTVYVAHDDRHTIKPEWLDSFTDTGEELISDDNGVAFSLFSKTFPAGTVVLGGNSPDGTGFSMYTVVVAPE